MKVKDIFKLLLFGAMLSCLAMSVFAAHDSSYKVGTSTDMRFLAQELMGRGVSVSPYGRLVGTTAGDQIGWFSNLTCEAVSSFTNGVILSTGGITQGPGLSNTSVSRSWDSAEVINFQSIEDWDADLENACYTDEYGYPESQDVAGIVLYVTPSNSTINIPFLMASEEFFHPYGGETPRYRVPSSIEAYRRNSDKFAFFLKKGEVVGAGDPNDFRYMDFSAEDNIARLPDGGVVEIFSVNQHTNSEFFIANVETNNVNERLIFPTENIPIPMEYNGVIVGPTAVCSNVVPGEVYTLKIVLADISDRNLNSVIFLQGVTSGADLKMEVSSPGTVDANRRATFTDKVLNIGPAVANGVVVTNYLPIGVTQADVELGVPSAGTVTEWGETGGTNYFVWAVGNGLQVKKPSEADYPSEVLSFTCTLPINASTFTNAAVVGTITGDYDMSNNMDEAVVQTSPVHVLRIEAITTNKVYGTELALTDLQYILSVDGTNETQIVSGIDVSFTNALGEVADPTAAAAPVGTYKIYLASIRGFDLSFFTGGIEYVSGELTITPCPVTITANDKERAYDGTPLTESGYSAPGLLSGDTLTVAMTADSTITDVGTQPNVIATVDGVAVETGVEKAIGNYLVTTVDGLLTITAAPLNVTVNGDSGSKVYNGSEQTYNGTVTATSADAGFDASKFSYTGAKSASGTNVGDYTTALDSTACVYSDANYTVNWTIGTPVKLTITPATLNVTVNGDCDSKVYNGSEQTFDGTVTATSADVGFDASKFSYTGAKTASGTDIGDYTTALDSAACSYNDANYTVNWTVGTPVKLTITPATLNVTVNGDSDTEVYNGSEQTFDGTVTATSSDAGFDASKFSYTGAKTASGTNIGDYTTALNAAACNYSDANYTVNWTVGTPVKLTITPATLNVTIDGNSDSRVYNGSEQTFEGTVTATSTDGGFDASKFSYTGAKSASGTNVGDYTTALDSTACVYSDANYTVNWTVGTPVKLTITPASLNVTVNGDSDSKVYNGSEQTFDGTVTATSTDAGFDASKFSYTGAKSASGPHVGDYTTALDSTACVYSDANYTVNWSVGAPVKLTITPAPLNVTVNGDSDSKVYNGSEQTYDGTVTATSADAGFDSSKFSYTGAKSASGTNVGNYTTALIAAACNYSDANYTVSWTVGTPVKLTITPATLNVTVDGNSDSRVYNGSEQTFDGTVTATSTDGGFDASKFSYTGAKTASGTDVGEYTTALDSTACVYSDENYTVVWTIGAPVKLTITLGVLNIVVNGNSDSKVYNGSEQTFDGTVTATSADAGFDASKFSYTGAKSASGTNVGDYTTALDSTACVYSDTNYTVNWTVGTPVKLTITPASLNVTVNGDSDSKVYNGNEQTFDGTVTATSADAGFDASKFSYTGAKSASGTNIGDYTTALDSAECVYSDTNYAVTWTVGTPVKLTITPAPLNVTVDGDSGSKVYNGSEQTYEGTVTATSADAGFDSSKFSYTGAKSASGTNVGDYTTALDSAACAYSDANYAVTWTVGTPVKLTITPATLNVTVNGNSDSRVYNGSEQTFNGTVTATSADAGFDASKFSYNGAKSASGTDVGEYTTALIATACSYGDNNYTVVWTVGTPVKLTITPATLNVTVNGDSDTKVYNGNEQTYDGTVTATSADANFDVSKFSYTGAKSASGTDVGDHTTVLLAASCSYSDANYTASWTIGTPVKLTITPATITVIAKDQSKGYGDVLTFTGGPEEFTVTGLQGGDTVTSVHISSAKAAATDTEVGTYADEIVPFHAVTGINTNNYDIVFSNGTLTVTQALLTVTVNDATWRVGKSRPEYSFADFSAQLKGGDTMAGITGGRGLASDVTFTNAVWNATEPTDTDKGEYPEEIWLDVVSLDGARAANYVIETVPGKLTITSGEPALKTTVSATLNWNTGLLDLELAIRNEGDAEVDANADFWVQLTPGAAASGALASVDRTHYLVSPMGTLTNGSDYIDLTAVVKSLLRAVGNGDEVFDPGEAITLRGVSVYHWKRWSPELFIDENNFFVAGKLDDFLANGGSSNGGQTGPVVSAKVEGETTVASEEPQAMASQGVSASAETLSATPLNLGDFTASSPVTYTGWLRDGAGGIAALIKVTTTAVKKEGAYARSTIAVTPFDGSKKRRYRSEILPGGNPTDEFGVTYGNLGLAGTLEGCTIVAGRDFARAKTGTPEKALADSMPVGAWTLPDGTVGATGLTVTVGRRGKAKVRGTLSDGKALLVSAQGVLVEGRDFAIPVMNAKKGIGFVAWIAESGAVTVTDVSRAERATSSAKKMK